MASERIDEGDNISMCFFRPTKAIRAPMQNGSKWPMRILCKWWTSPRRSAPEAWSLGFNEFIHIVRNLLRAGRRQCHNPGTHLHSARCRVGDILTWHEHNCSYSKLAAKLRCYFLRAFLAELGNLCVSRWTFPSTTQLLFHGPISSQNRDCQHSSDSHCAEH